MVASLLIRVSPLHTGASVIFLLIQVSAFGNEAYQAVISLRMQIKSPPVERCGASSTKNTLILTQSRRTAKLETSPLFPLTPIDYLKAGKRGIANHPGKGKESLRQ